MVFNIPDTPEELINRSATDIQNELQEANPFLKNSLLKAMSDANAGRVGDFYDQLNILIVQLFMDTATGEFLERWGSYKDILRNPATQSTGNVTATGVVSSSIPLGSSLQSSDGNQYLSTATVVIANSTLSITTLTRSGSTVTATTASDHLLGSGIDGTIAGAVESGYNGTFPITVTASNEFTYDITTTPTTPATGVITVSADVATVPVESVDFGNAQNQLNGTQLTFTSPIAGVDNVAVVQFTELDGGTDIESDDDLRDRIIDRYQNPIAHFSVNDIINQARRVSGVTRVFVYESGDLFGDALTVSSITRSGDFATVTTSTPHNLEDVGFVAISGANEPEYNGTFRVLVIDSLNVGYVVAGSPSTPATGSIVAQPSVALGRVFVYFTRDNDLSIIPTAQEVQDVKDELDLIRPANTSTFDLVVNAPVPVPTAFTFTSLVPNTTTMQASITANLDALFREDTEVGIDLREDEYRSIIFQTLDTETGARVESFVLSAPTGDITIGPDEIATLGTVTYP